MQKPVPANVARRLRARYMLAGAMLLALWSTSVVALFHGGSDMDAGTTKGNYSAQAILKSALPPTSPSGRKAGSQRPSQ